MLVLTHGRYGAGLSALQQLTFKDQQRLSDNERAVTPARYPPGQQAGCPVDPVQQTLQADCVYCCAHGLAGDMAKLQNMRGLQVRPLFRVP